MKSLFTLALISSTQLARAHQQESRYWSQSQLDSYSAVAQRIVNFVDHQPDSYQFGVVKPEGGVASCEKCLATMTVVSSVVARESFQSLLVSTFSDLCFLVSSEIPASECQLYVSGAVPTIAANLAQFILSPQYSCQVELGRCNRDWYTRDSVDEYADRVLATKPSSLVGDNFVNQLYHNIETEAHIRKNLEIIQFTDLHIDFDYKVGANTDCIGEICCRESSGMATDPSKGAGPYGSVSQCDIPKSVLEKMAEKINSLKPDVLFWTGDVAPHDQTNYTQEYVEQYQTYLYDFMKENLSDWRTFAIEGNHDFGQVINSQDFSQTDPIIPYLAEQWSEWLSESALEEFKVNGFYTQKFATNDKVYDKVNVVAINTEAAYAANYYLIGTRQDPGDQLAWLEDKLTMMEQNGEIAILIGHHPPASTSQLTEWTLRFRILMDRFQHIIRFGFFGHVHAEEHNVIKSWESNQSIGLNFWSGSMTTYSNKYPSFRRFIVDEETMLPIKVETWTLDVYAQEPEFVLDHELSHFYEMKDLSPASFDALAERMHESEDLSLKYIHTQSQQGNLSQETCDSDCRTEVYCDTQSSTYHDARICRGFKPLDVLATDPGYAIAYSVMQPWYTYNRATEQYF